MDKIIYFDPPEKKEPECAFCKKPKNQVQFLIGEEGKPHICSSCVEKCAALLAAHAT